ENRLTVANTAYGFEIQMLRAQFPLGIKSLSNYTALIDIKDGKAYVTIKLKKGVLAFMLVWYICILAVYTTLTIQGNSGGIVFLVLLAVFPSFLVRERRMFTRFVID